MGKAQGKPFEPDFDRAKSPDRRGASRGQEVRAMPQHQPGNRGDRADLRVSEVDLRTGSPQSLHLGFDVLVERLVDKGQHGAQAMFASIPGAGEPPVRAKSPHRENRRTISALRLRYQPLELPDLVPSPAAVAKKTLIFQPDFSRTTAQAEKPSDRGGNSPKSDSLKRVLEDRKQMVKSTHPEASDNRPWASLTPTSSRFG